MALAAGVNTRFPAATSAVVITWPAVTAVPDRVSVPAVGSVSIRTALKLSPASTSLNPKFAVVKVWVVSSLMVTVALVPAGASFTLVTVIVKVSS